MNMHATSGRLCSSVESALYCELSTAFTPCEFRVKWAAGAWEHAQALKLRRAVFCVEQGLFQGDDLDEIDKQAQCIVALSCVGGMADQLVGTVRIHEQPESGLGVWWGSRLAVHAAFRQHSRLGATLIRLAVASAHARGCRRFFAHVQSQNVTLFERLGWASLCPVQLHGRPHQLMQADLAHYPPCHAPFTGYVAQAKPSACLSALLSARLSA